MIITCCTRLRASTLACSGQTTPILAPRLCIELCCLFARFLFCCCTSALHHRRDPVLVRSITPPVQECLFVVPRHRLRYRLRLSMFASHFSSLRSLRFLVSSLIASCWSRRSQARARCSGLVVRTRMSFGRGLTGLHERGIMPSIR
jgi:hypothetical protein